MIHREDRDGIAVLRIEHGKANALDAELLEGLAERLRELERDRPEAVVLTGTGSIFSAGVDLFRVLDGGRAYLERFLPVLGRSLERLFAFPGPVVAAVNGHAIAGGCILACACDLKVMAEGDGRIGVPELRVGVPFPVAALEILRFAVPPQHLQKLAYVGRTYGPRDAQAWGLVDELVPPERLLERSIEAARELAAIPAGSFELTKAHLRRPAVERIRAYRGEIDPGVAKLWAEETIHDHVREYLDRTIGRKA
ncbi:MAG: enoyl-CoA hydratase/isomerase family protein [Thermoanaerobaculia bacterium]